MNKYLVRNGIRTLSIVNISPDGKRLESCCARFSPQTQRGIIAAIQILEANANSNLHSVSCCEMRYTVERKK